MQKEKRPINGGQAIPASRPIPSSPWRTTDVDYVYGLYSYIGLCEGVVALHYPAPAFAVGASAGAIWRLSAGIQGPEKDNRFVRVL